MEKEITNKLEDIIKILEKKFSNNKLVEEFEKTSLEFESLVKKGVITKRGNNSLSIIERSNVKITFNGL